MSKPNYAFQLLIGYKFASSLLSTFLMQTRSNSFKLAKSQNDAAFLLHCNTFGLNLSSELLQVKKTQHIMANIYTDFSIGAIWH